MHLVRANTTNKDMVAVGGGHMCLSNEVNCSGNENQGFMGSGTHLWYDSIDLRRIAVILEQPKSVGP